MSEQEALAYLKRFGLYLAEEFSGAKRGEWRCPMIGAEAATSIVEAIAVLSQIGGSPGACISGDEEMKEQDHGASLLRVDPSAAVTTEPLPGRLSSREIATHMWNADGRPDGHQLGEAHLGTYLRQSREVLKAIRDLGFRVVPNEKRRIAV